jgi:hypothetical protein
MPKDLTIEEGNSLSKLGEEHGFACDTLWNHEQNAALREARTHPNVLLPGDVGHIPDRQPKSVPAVTGKRHCFRRRSIPARFRLQLFRGTKPMAGAEYALEADGVRYSGQTDAEGVIDVWISPGAANGVLTIGSGASAISRKLAFSHLHPVAVPTGLSQRLHNLGYLPSDAASAEEMTFALRAFQGDAELTSSGEADAATVAKLEEIHDHKGLFPQPPPDDEATEEEAQPAAETAEGPADDWQDNAIVWEPPASG